MEGFVKSVLNNPRKLFLLVTVLFTLVLFTKGFKAGIFGLTIALYAYFQLKADLKQKGNVKKKYAFITNEMGFELFLLELVAFVIRADGNTAVSELAYVRKSLDKHFEPDKVQKLMKVLQKKIENPVDPRKACRYVVAEFTLSSKVQLLHLLIGIATADRFLSVKEYKAIKVLGRQMRIPYRIFKSVLAMFRFVQEGERKRFYSRPTSKSKTSLNEAFAVLGISSGANETAIKKAYRKLAKLHHPDKVIHMGPDFQLDAKEKFQKVQEAYEIVKSHKGFA